MGRWGKWANRRVGEWEAYLFRRFADSPFRQLALSPRERALALAPLPLLPRKWILNRLRHLLPLLGRQHLLHFRHC